MLASYRKFNQKEASFSRVVFNELFLLKKKNYSMILSTWHVATELEEASFLCLSDLRTVAPIHM